MIEMAPIAMFAVAFAALLAGYSVALTLAGVACLFAFIGIATGTFNPNDLGFLPGRMFGIIANQTLIAVPLFIFMGVMLEKTRIAHALLDALSTLLGGVRGGLALAVRKDSTTSQGPPSFSNGARSPWPFRVAHAAASRSS